MKKGNPLALLPILVFLVLFIGVGVITGDFYKMPATVGFLIALFVALLQNPKKKLGEKLSIAAKGSGDENIMVMVLIFVLAGAFSASVKAAGGAESAVNFGLSILPANVAVVGVFVIGCLISLSMGTSVGTIVALAPIAAGISDKAGIPMAMCLGAVVCGAMFGDNLSMISDTTIAATRTQNCPMNVKFKENFKIVLPAAIATLLIFLALTFNSSYQVDGELTYNIVRMLPYLLVLVTALIGMNVLVVLGLGIIFSLAVGLCYGDFALLDIFNIMGDGMVGMYDIAILSVICGAVFALIRENGGVDFILYCIKKSVKGKKGAEIGVATMVLATDIATANNTVAIVIAGPIAKDISDEFELEPKRVASLLDIFSSVGQGLIPYGAQILTAAAAPAALGFIEVSPLEIVPFMFYPVLMVISALMFILIPKRK